MQLKARQTPWRELCTLSFVDTHLGTAKNAQDCTLDVLSLTSPSREVPHIISVCPSQQRFLPLRMYSCVSMALYSVVLKHIINSKLSMTPHDSGALNPGVHARNKVVLHFSPGKAT